MTARAKPPGVLPGFRLTLGFTLFYLCLIVLIPLSSLPVRTASMGWDAFWATVSAPRVVASYRLTLTTSFVAGCTNGLFGLLVAWVLVRYEFPGRRIVDAAIDLPFALPTAVAGITLTTLYAPNGWLGAPLAAYGIPVAFTPLGITVALIFIDIICLIATLRGQSLSSCVNSRLGRPKARCDARSGSAAASKLGIGR